MIKLAVFDLAGTTVFDEDAVNSVFRATLAARGVEADPKVVNSVMGLPKPQAIEILLDQFGRQCSWPPTPANIAAIHEDFTQRMCAFYTHDPAVREIPGARAVFARLRERNVKVAVTTGFFRAITDVLLHRLGWSVPATFDASLSSDEVRRGRPFPEMILKLMGDFGITHANAVAKIGDTKADLEEGTNAGCGLVIGVTTGAYSREQLQSYPHTHIVPSVNEACELIIAANET
jgi:phosphonatase-like hydrolase